MADDTETQLKKWRENYLISHENYYEYLAT